MMNDIKRIEAFLQLIKDIAIQKEINNNTIYSNLICTDTTSNNIQYMFNDWVEDFRNVDNITVFVQENWKNFCQFRSTNEKYISLSDKIKMYIPLDKDHIYEGARQLFKFIAENDIIHTSKISRFTRFDDIVLRVNGIESANKIKNFILNNPYIMEGLTPPNPFAFNDGHIAYAWDGNLSYNDTISKYIAMYINSLKNENKLNEVSYLGLLTFVKNIYKQIFIDGEGREYFIEMMNLYGEDDYEEQIKFEDTKNITIVFLKALMPDKKIEDFYQIYNSIVEYDDEFLTSLYESMTKKYHNPVIIENQISGYLADGDICHFPRNAAGTNVRKKVGDRGLTKEKLITLANDKERITNKLLNVARKTLQKKDNLLKNNLHNRVR